MKNHYEIISSMLIAWTLATSLAACSSASTKQQGLQARPLPVNWTTEFQMASLLEQAPAVSSQADLSKLLEQPWYSRIDVELPETKEIRTIGTCEDYFAVKAIDLRAQKEQEHSALMELAVMCEATRLLSQAAPARQSNIPPQPLDAKLPYKLPKEVALVTSQSELTRVVNDKSLSRWSDINNIHNVEQSSKLQSNYLSDAGLQTLSIMGRGDFNADGVEDVLVSVKDSVEGGSYVNFRLLILTVTDQGNWKIAGTY